MNAEELEIRQRLKDDFEHYASKCLKIRTKPGNIEPFIVNSAQKYVHFNVEEQLKKTGKIRAMILKGRQTGMSTYIEGRFYWKVTHRRGVLAFILTHEDDATNNLFNMAKRYHDNCPLPVRPSTKSSNAKELIFSGMDSGYKIGTAGNPSVGRSATVQYLHASEVAMYKHAQEHAAGIMQTVPNAPGTEIFIESTAKGVGNWFHQQWQDAEAGESEFMPLFVPWYWMKEYTEPLREDFKLEPDEKDLKEQFNLIDEQLQWRRIKIKELSVNGLDGSKLFDQEYPNTSALAFILSGEDGYISPELVVRARKTVINDRYGPLIIGVDPARFGDDRAAIIRRQGRRVFGKETYIKKDTMELTGIVHRIIEKENPRYVAIDVGGLGAGIVDRLIEMGHKDIIYAVNSGSKPLDDRKYLNKRAEMWSMGKQWLENEPCSLPDDDELQSDICNTKYRLDSANRLVIEPKAEMKKRGVRSSDTADAWLMTFAIPDSMLRADYKNSKEDKVKKVMEKFTRIQKINKRALHNF